MCFNKCFYAKYNINSFKTLSFLYIRNDFELFSWNKLLLGVLRFLLSTHFCIKEQNILQISKSFLLDKIRFKKNKVKRSIINYTFSSFSFIVSKSKVVLDISLKHRAAFSEGVCRKQTRYAFRNFRRIKLSKV